MRKLEGDNITTELSDIQSLKEISDYFNSSKPPDNDGLTDGQEVRWITGTNPVTGLEKKDLTPSTDPKDKDTDGDGYWDGWIGVHNTTPDNTDKIILYMENLNNGIQQEDEIIQSQIETHDISEAPSTIGAKIPRDKKDEFLELAEEKVSENVG